MIVREVEPGDQEAWQAMRSALWPDCTAERHASEMAAYSTRGGAFATLVAMHEDGQLMGFVEASLREWAEGCDTHPVGYIEGIFVLPAFRRSGVGCALAAAVEMWAVSQGCTEFASDCHAENEASIQFHRRLGFAIARRIVHFRKDR